jgi:hypothetical protein
VYVNRLELSVVVNPLTSADGISRTSNDSGLLFEHSFPGAAHCRKPADHPRGDVASRSSVWSYQVWSELSQGDLLCCRNRVRVGGPRRFDRSYPLGH